MILLNGLIPNDDIKIDFVGLRPGEKLTEELLTSSDNCLPTHNKRLFVAKPEILDSEKIIKGFNLLKDKINRNSSNRSIVKLLKRYIPEFISNNSIYSELD